MQSQAADVPAINLDGSTSGFYQTEEGQSQRGFAGSGTPHNAYLEKNVSFILEMYYLFFI